MQMVTRGAHVGCLTCGGTYVFLHLRSVRSLNGGTQTDTTWQLKYHVAMFNDCGVRPTVFQCFAEALHQAITDNVEWTGEQRLHTAVQKVAERRKDSITGMVKSRCDHQRSCSALPTFDLQIAPGYRALSTVRCAAVRPRTKLQGIMQQAHLQMQSVQDLASNPPPA